MPLGRTSRHPGVRDRCRANSPSMTWRVTVSRTSAQKLRRPCFTASARSTSVTSTCQVNVQDSQDRYGCGRAHNDAGRATIG